MLSILGRSHWRGRTRYFYKSFLKWSLVVYFSKEHSFDVIWKLIIFTFLGRGYGCSRRKNYKNIPIHSLGLYIPNYRSVVIQKKVKHIFNSQSQFFKCFPKNSPRLYLSNARLPDVIRYFRFADVATSMVQVDILKVSQTFSWIIQFYHDVLRQISKNSIEWVW